MAFYRRELGRDVSIDADEELIVERRDHDVVAALRLVPEAGSLTLRTMVVAEGMRGSGLGSVLLASASVAIGTRECYCIPWSHLESFYGRIGFVRTAVATIPPHLRERVGDEHSVIAMRRAAAPG